MHLTAPLLLLFSSSPVIAQDIYGMSVKNPDDVMVPDNVDPCVLLPSDLISSVARQNSWNLVARIFEIKADPSPRYLISHELCDLIQNQIDLSLLDIKHTEPVTSTVNSYVGQLPLIGSVLNYIWPDDQSFAAAIGLLNVKFTTPFDQRLIDWILLQEDHSVTPGRLFLQALSLTNGNVEQALLASHNALTSIRTLPNRAETPLAKKLVIVSNADNVGGWYHFFAAAYCTYRRPQPLYYKLGVTMENAVSYFKEPTDETERIAGLNGVDFGIALRGLRSNCRVAAFTPTSP